MIFWIPLEPVVNDKPSFRAAVNGPERSRWFGAMDREHANLCNHDAYEEVAEDSLSTWDRIKQRASEVIKTLWVLIRKRDGDANLLEGDAAYKGRCVVDGANQKCSAVAAGKEIFTFMPTVRTATNKTQCAHACR